jgi:hypothetical protein
MWSQSPAPAACRACALALRTAATLAVSVLMGCGGGISIGFGIGGEFDVFQPSVSIAAPLSSVQAGQAFTLVAAASDQSGIDEVAFYRLDGNVQVRLGSDGSAPYEWLVVAPSDGRTTLQVFARAIDNAGNRADSQILTLSVTP